MRIYENIWEYIGLYRYIVIMHDTCMNDYECIYEPVMLERTHVQRLVHCCLMSTGQVKNAAKRRVPSYIWFSHMSWVSVKAGMKKHISNWMPTGKDTLTPISYFGVPCFGKAHISIHFQGARPATAAWLGSCARSWPTLPHPTSRLGPWSFAHWRLAIPKCVHHELRFSSLKYSSKSIQGLIKVAGMTPPGEHLARLLGDLVVVQCQVLQSAILL